MTLPVPAISGLSGLGISLASCPDADVVIVGYHSRDLIARSLDSLAGAARGIAVSVIVADNHSCDGTVEAVTAQANGSYAFDMGANLGFARANNRAMAMGNGRYVLVLNPDTVLDPRAITTLVDFADTHEGVGIVAPRLLNADRTPQKTARAFPTPAAALFGRRSPLTRWFPDNRWSRAFLTEDAHKGDEPFEADWVSGAAMLVPRSVIDEVGGFDEDFFLFWEDADWCRRIKEAGYAVWCVPQATVVHDEGGTRDHGWSTQSIVWFHKGAYLYWTKRYVHHPPIPVRWVVGALLAGRAAALIVIHGCARRFRNRGAL